MSAGVILLLIAVVTFYGAGIKAALDRLNSQIENVRYLLGEIERRSQTMTGKLHGIEKHTERAVRERYNADIWRDDDPLA